MSNNNITNNNGNASHQLHLGFNKDKTIRFFASSLHQIPAAYAQLDTNRMTLVHFAVHALDIMGVWDDEELLETHQLSARRIIDWIYSCLFLNDGCMGGTFTGPAAAVTGMDEEENNSSMICQRIGPDEPTASASLEQQQHQGLTPYHRPHIAMTYCALLTLIALGDDGSQSWMLPDRKKLLLENIRSLQRRDGSFGSMIAAADSASDHETAVSEQDMRFLYCACAISYLLDDWSGVNVDLAILYIRSCRAYDGGIALVPGQEGHGGSTFCGLAALVLMGRLDVLTQHENRCCTSTTVTWKEELIHWCVHRQQQEAGGMQGRPNKLKDTCYSYWIGGSLRLLGQGQDSLLDHAALQQFILSCQSPVGGFAKAPGAYPDILHSFYSLAWLSLSNDGAGYHHSHDADHRDPEETLENCSSESSAMTTMVRLPLHRLNATLGLRQERVDQYRRQQQPQNLGICELP